MWVCFSFVNKFICTFFFFFLDLTAYFYIYLSIPFFPPFWEISLVCSFSFAIYSLVIVCLLFIPSTILSLSAAVVVIAVLNILNLSIWLSFWLFFLLHITSIFLTTVVVLFKNSLFVLVCLLDSIYVVQFVVFLL